MANINKLVIESILNNNPSDSSSPNLNTNGSEAQPQIEFDKKPKRNLNLIDKLKKELE